LPGGCDLKNAIGLLSLLGTLTVHAAPKVKELPLPDGSTAGLVLPGKAKGKLPLVIWLHGGLGANDPAKGAKAARNMAAWADSSGFALLCPSAWPASPWFSPSAQARVEALITQASLDKNIGKGAIVLAGTSDGGTGALWLAGQMRPGLGNRLRAVAVWSCNPSVLANYGLAFEPRALSGLPLRWAQGGRDRLFALQDVRQWWNQCLAARVKLQSHPVENAGHDMADWQADQSAFGAWIKTLK
jgi:dienelactone hydrolase